MDEIQQIQEIFVLPRLSRNCFKNQPQLSFSETKRLTKRESEHVLPRPAKQLLLCVNLNLLPHPAEQPGLDRVVACESLPIVGPIFPLNQPPPTDMHTSSWP